RARFLDGDAKARHANAARFSFTQSAKLNAKKSRLASQARPMISGATRLLINVLSIIGLGWISYIIYGSITDRGVWHVVLRATSSDYSYSPAGTFAICM